MNEAIMILTIMVNPSYIVNGSSALTTNIIEYKDMTKCTNGVTQLKNTYKSAGHLLVEATCVEK
jgi:hypothetical protein